MEKSEPKSVDVNISYLKSGYDDSDALIPFPCVNVMRVEPGASLREREWFCLSIGPASFYFEDAATIRELVSEIDSKLRNEVRPS